MEFVPFSFLFFGSFATFHCIFVSGSMGRLSFLLFFGVEFSMKELGSPLKSPLKHIGLASIFFLRLLVERVIVMSAPERCAYPESMRDDQMLTLSSCSL